MSDKGNKVFAVIGVIFMFAVFFIILGLGLSNRHVNIEIELPKEKTYKLHSIHDGSSYAGNFLFIREYTHIVYWIENEDGSYQRRTIPFHEDIRFYEEDRTDGTVTFPMDYDRCCEDYEQWWLAVFRVPKGTIKIEHNLDN